MKLKWNRIDEIETKFFFQRIETWVREFPGGINVVVVGKESNGKEGIFHQGSHLHTHIGAHTHIHDKGVGGGGGESFPRVKVYTLPVRFFFLSFLRIETTTAWNKWVNKVLDGGGGEVICNFWDKTPINEIWNS